MSPNTLLLPPSLGGTGRMLVACDLDTVFLAGEAEERLHLHQLIARHPDIGLVFLTGRSQEAVMPLLDDPTLPSPEYLVCDAGATVVDTQNRPVLPLQAEIDARWPGEHVVAEALAGFGALIRQDVPQRNRCAYVCAPEALDDPALQARLEALGCEARHTQGRYLDVLPRGVGPLDSLRRLAEHLGWPAERVLVVTTELSAVELRGLPEGFRVVMPPGACAPELARAMLTRHVMRAGREGCGAVLEAMAHFGFLGEKALHALAYRKAPEGEARLVVVYHRLPYEEHMQGGQRVRRRPRSPNGIIPTLLSFFKDGTEGSWVAWAEHDPGQGAFEVHTPVDARRFPNLTAARVPLTAHQVEVFYQRFSKEAFWPVLHTFWERARFDEDDWNVYLDVNRAFAEATAREAAQGATVWLHDYNLWMVPAFLRERRPDLRLAFFHHTHFPSADLFNVLPWRRQIVASLLQCDHIGFHIPRQVENFVDVVRGMAPVEVLETTACAPRFLTYGCALGIDRMSTRIRVHGRTVGLGAHPVGLDVGRIREAVDSPRHRALREGVRRELGETRVVLSVERLDFTKGILPKLLAYERFLEAQPEWHGRVTLVTVCVPAAKAMRVYDELRRQIEQVVGRINGRFARIGWTPLRFYFRSFDIEEVAAFYAEADVMWITPLCDGLNLVAQEYVAAQALTEGSGVLLLSEFAGAAAVLKEALRTNPHDPQDLQARLLEALTLPAADARNRLRHLFDTVSRHDVAFWGQDFLAAAGRDPLTPPDLESNP